MSGGSIAVGGLDGFNGISGGYSSAGGESVRNSPMMGDRRRTLRPARMTLAPPSEDDADSGKGFDARNDGQVILVSWQKNLIQ